MGKEQADMDIAEFISALAAGNNAQLIVAALGGAATDYSIVLALAAAAHQTGGRIVCILSKPDQLQFTKDDLGHDSSQVEFVVGEAESIVMSRDYSEVDFVVVDCNLGNHENVVRGMDRKGPLISSVVVGYNALRNRSSSSRFGKHLLPIGGGLVVTRIAANDYVDGRTRKRGWVVKVDECTGEEHVFRVRSTRGNQVETLPFRSVSL